MKRFLLFPITLYERVFKNLISGLWNNEAESANSKSSINYLLITIFLNCFVMNNKQLHSHKLISRQKKVWEKPKASQIYFMFNAFFANSSGHSVHSVETVFYNSILTKQSHLFILAIVPFRLC